MFRDRKVEVTLQKAEPGTNKAVCPSQKRLTGLKHGGLQGARLNPGRTHFLGGSRAPVAPAALGIVCVHMCVSRHLQADGIHANNVKRTKG